MVMMKKRMAACAVAFAASAMVGFGAPAAAAQAEAHSTETTEITAQAYYKEGTYSSEAACRTAGSYYSGIGQPWYCEAVDTGGRPNYELWVAVG